ncbi:MAG: 3-phosphoshikimate 1-carboxyvinyltransferase [Gemmatimonadota bacterium]
MQMKTETLSIVVPGDKSLTHRALLFGALASGRSVVRLPLIGADTSSTAHALRMLGCSVPKLDREMAIDGVGLRGFRSPDREIDCGNSGTTTRLLMGILAGQDVVATLTGDASLRSRPMRRVTRPLVQMGARFDELGEADRLPIRIHGGTLRPLDYESPHASAQVKSAVLLAGLTGGVRASVVEPLLSRDHTERMLARMGVPLARESLPDGRPRVTLTPVASLGAFEFDVPGDFSSAAFVIAIGCLAAPAPIVIRGVGLNPARIGMLDVLRRMGAAVTIENERESCGEPLGDIVVERSRLRGVHITAAEIPALVDEVPVIAALAARAEGTTTVEGAGELRVKESDRINAVVSNLQAIGADAEELPDGLVVHGSDHPLNGRVRALHDHRVAMAFGVLAAAADAGIRIDDPDVVSVSYPDFWSMLRTVTGSPG